MHVEQDRPGVCGLALVLGEHQRLGAVRELPRGETALAERELQPIGILLDVGRNDGIVRHRQELEELGKVSLCGLLDEVRRNFARLRAGIGDGAERHGGHHAGGRQQTGEWIYWSLRRSSRIVFSCSHRAAVRPPSTVNTVPLTYDAASDARNTAAPPISSVLPQRPSGVRALICRPSSVSTIGAVPSVRK